MTRKRYYRCPRGFRSGSQLYRLPSCGMISGVCAGVAHYFRISRTALRVLACAGALVTGIMPILVLYAVLTYILPVREDVTGPEHGLDWQKNHHKPSREGLRQQRAGLLKSLQETEQKINRLESYLISSEYEWERKYRGL